MALILGTAGNDQLVGTPGLDVIDGRAGDDRLDGGWGDDVLIGGQGNDVLVGGVGRDRLIGGPGDDHLIGSGLSALDEDTADYSGARGPIRADLAAGIVTGEGRDRIEGVVTLIGTRFADHLAGGPITIKLDGGSGDDVLIGDWRSTRLSGGEGNDTLIGAVAHYRDSPGPLLADLGSCIVQGPGRDRLIDVTDLIGSAGADRILGSADQNVLDGDAGDDELRGRAGDDRLSGGAGDDRLIGGPGDDELGGDAGDDLIRGGPGNDRFLPSAGDDRLEGGDGTDRILIASAADFGEVFTIDLRAGAISRDGSVVGSARYRGIEVVEIHPHTYAHIRIAGTAAADTLATGITDGQLIGRQGDDVLTGGAGDDRLVGGGGDDRLDDGDSSLHGGGRDRLLGGVGDDVLVSRIFGDLLDGGPGADLFVMTQDNRGRWIASPPGDPDRILGFVPDDGDRIDLSAIYIGELYEDDDPPEAFTFVGAASFTDRGQVGYRIVGDETIVEATIGTGPDVGLRLVIDGVWTLTAACFVL